MTQLDLLLVVADKNMEAAVTGLLSRPASLGIRPVDFELQVHPRSDPGCFYEGADLLRAQQGRARHALIMFDADWQGAPSDTATKLEALMQQDFLRKGVAGWAEAIVIAPELEAWVFSDSPHVADALGRVVDSKRFRERLDAEGLWTRSQSKPDDPKAAVEWALHQKRQPRSSSTYRNLAMNVSFRRCSDPAFVRFRSLLQAWFL